jgi:hypothetical protein
VTTTRKKRGPGRPKLMKNAQTLHLQFDDKHVKIVGKLVKIDGGGDRAFSGCLRWLIEWAHEQGVVDAYKKAKSATP